MPDHGKSPEGSPSPRDQQLPATANHTPAGYVARAVEQTPRRYTPKPLSWDRLTKTIGLPNVGDKTAGGLWFFGELQRHRKITENVLSRSLFTLDADDLSPANDLAERVKALGCAAVMYPTHQHTAEAPRYRVLVLPDRAIAPDEYRPALMALESRLGGGFDPSMRSVAQAIYAPTTTDADEYRRRVLVAEGEPVSVDDLLVEADALGLQIDSQSSGEVDPYDGPDYDVLAPERQAWAREHVEVTIRFWRERLTAAADWPEGQHDDRGRGWDAMARDAAYALAKKAVHPAYPLGLDEAERMYRELVAPFGSAVPEKWGRAVDKAENEPPEVVAWPSTPAEDFEPVEEDSEPAEDDKAARVRAAFPLLDLAALVDPLRPPRKWLLDDVVPQGEHVSIVAPAGEGKSLLVLALVVACARGDARFLGRSFGERPACILYIDMENSEDDWAERLLSLGVTSDNVADLMRMILPLHLPRLRGLDTDKGARQLRDVLDAYGLSAGDLVVLDSTQRVTEGEENSNDTIRKLYNLTSADLKRRGLTVIRTDNTGHDRSRARGASAKRDDVGYSWMLIPDEEDPELFALVRSKKRAAVKDAGAIRFRRSVDSDGMLSFAPATSTYVDKLAEIVDLLDELSIEPTTSERAALRAVKNAQTAGEAPEWITERLVKAAHKSRGECRDDAP